MEWVKRADYDQRRPDLCRFICHQLSSRGPAQSDRSSSRIIRVVHGRGFVATTSSRFRFRRRSGTAASLLVWLCATACSAGSAAPHAQQLTLWSGIAAEFTNDLIQRFNSALRETHIDLRTTSGGVVVVAAVDGG